MVKQDEAGLKKTTLAVALAKNAIPVNQFASSAADVAGLDFSTFDDLSLPPIIKANGLNQGDVIFGEIDSFNIYDDGDKIKSALVTLQILRYDSEQKQFVKAGVRGAMPIGAVLARSLGAPVGKDIPPQTVIDAIKNNGYVKGTILAMRYQGVGKKRGALNAPHLWDIKAQKPGGETMSAPSKKRH